MLACKINFKRMDEDPYFIRSWGALKNICQSVPAAGNNVGYAHYLHGWNWQTGIAWCRQKINLSADMRSTNSDPRARKTQLETLMKIGNGRQKCRVRYGVQSRKWLILFLKGDGLLQKGARTKSRHWQALHWVAKISKQLLRCVNCRTGDNAFWEDTELLQSFLIIGKYCFRMLLSTQIAAVVLKSLPPPG